jgi:ABC-2 type transport system ATP-binding protein
VSAVALHGLVKRYGATAALNGLDLTVPEGSIFGFLGPNGAGKTTTLRILTGMARPTAGSAEVLGFDATRPDAALRRQVGFLPDVPAFYPWMTARELMRFAGRLFGLDGVALEQRSESLLAMVGLATVKTRIGGYSRGMKQRLGIAQALVNAPRLLLLDEPTSALDPIGRREVLELIASLRGRTTVFFSTHILADVERVCDTVTILDRGAVVAGGPIDDLKRRHATNRLVFQVEGSSTVLTTRLRSRPWLETLDEADGAIRIATSDVATARREVVAEIAALQLGLVRFEQEDPTLEEVFVGLLGSRAP